MEREPQSQVESRANGEEREKKNRVRLRKGFGIILRAFFFFQTDFHTLFYPSLIFLLHHHLVVAGDLIESDGWM